MLKLAERMVASFCGGVTASVAHQWTTLSGSGAEDVRVMTRKSVDDPGRPPGIVLNAATSFWLPVTPSTVFDFLRDETSRSEVRFLVVTCHSAASSVSSRKLPDESEYLASGTFSPTAASSRRWLISPTAATTATASHSFVST
jgi:hypothetical protein